MQILKKAVANARQIYIVRRGQTIKDVAKHFEIPEHIIITENGLTGDVCEGDALLISSSQTQEYVVGVGETFESVCEKFGADREEVARLNGVDYVWVRMRLLLPKRKNEESDCCNK